MSVRKLTTFIAIPLVSVGRMIEHTGNFLLQLNGEKPSETADKALDVALILHADHELNASTFAARVIAATLSDMHSCITGAIGGTAGVVLSDMAANATGHKKTDHLRIIGLVELAADFACEILTDGGTFLAKVFQGGTGHALLARLKSEFAAVRHVKPRASRADSAELYVLATGFRGKGKR